MLPNNWTKARISAPTRNRRMDAALPVVRLCRHQVALRWKCWASFMSDDAASMASRPPPSIIMQDSCNPRIQRVCGQFETMSKAFSGTHNYGISTSERRQMGRNPNEAHLKECRPS